MTNLFKLATVIVLLAYATYFFTQGWNMAGGWIVFASILYVIIYNVPKAEK